MDDPLVAVVVVLCVVFAALAAILAVYSGRRVRRHQRRMQQWADRNGWTLTAHPHVEWGRRLPGGNTHGVSYTFSSVLDGRRVNVAQYSVTDASDGTTTNTHHHVVTVALLNRPLPSTQVESRGRASRLTSRFLDSGETATGNPGFDRDFRIRTREPAALRQWFSPPLIAAHRSGQVPSSWSVQGAELLCHRPGRLDPDEVQGHAAAVLPLADLLDGRDGRERHGDSG
jgi:hypothetical protein